MAEISKITLPTGTTYDIKDQGARDLIANLNSFEYTVCSTAATTPKDVIGYPNGTASSAVTGTLVASEDTTHKIYLVGNIVNPELAGDQFREYITVQNSNGNYFWEMFGTIGSVISGLGNLAFKDSASGSFTPEGTINVTLTTASKYVAASTTGGGSATAGTAAQCTLPVFSTSVSGETLTLGWTAGSFTPNTPTEVTMPTFAKQTIATAVSAKTFTGTAGTVTVS